MPMSAAAKEAKREYQWYRNNRDKANVSQKKLRQKNPDKLREYREKYWEQRAANNSE